MDQIEAVKIWACGQPLNALPAASNAFRVQPGGIQASGNQVAWTWKNGLAMITWAQAEGRWGHDWGARVQPVATIGGWKSLWNSNMRHPGAIWSSEFNVRCRSESSSKPLSIFKLDLFGETTVVSMAGAPKHAKTSNTHLQRCLQGTAQTWDLKPPKQIGQGQISTLVTGDFTLQV